MSRSNRGGGMGESDGGAGVVKLNAQGPEYVVGCPHTLRLKSAFSKPDILTCYWRKDMKEDRGP